MATGGPVECDQIESDVSIPTTRYKLSLDTVKSNRDILLEGARDVRGLFPGLSSTGTAVLSVPPSTRPGTYYLLACADDLAQVLETNEINNCRASASQVTVLP